VTEPEHAQSDAQRWARQVELVIAPTFGCNLSCAHCFVEPAPQRAAMSLADFCGLLSAGEQLGFRSFQITGGELFHWPHHLGALQALAKLAVPTVISTNGCLLAPEHLELIAGGKISLCFSLDGPAQIHDARRGADSFAAMAVAAERCRSHGVDFDISSTVGKAVLPHLAETVRLGVELGARAIYVSPVQQLGGRSAAVDEELLDDEECLDLIATLTLLEKGLPEGVGVYTRNIGMRVTATKHPCSVFACWGAYCPTKKFWPSQLAVLPNGLLLPISLHVHEQYALGNAFSEGLETLVQPYWQSPDHQRLQSLCRYVYQDLIYPSDQPFFFHSELLFRASALPFEQIPAYGTVSHPHDHTEEIEQARRRGRLPLIQFPIRSD